jgi:hypothetical protein
MSQRAEFLLSISLNCAVSLFGWPGACYKDLPGFELTERFVCPRLLSATAPLINVFTSPGAHCDKLASTMENILSFSLHRLPQFPHWLLPILAAAVFCSLFSTLPSQEQTFFSTEPSLQHRIAFNQMRKATRRRGEERGETGGERTGVRVF